MTRGQRIVLLVGSMGPLGHCFASGTVTVAVVGVPLFWLTHDWPPWVCIAGTLAFTAVSVRLHAAGDRYLGKTDSRCLVWDEVVGFLFAVAFVPFTWQLAALAFALERTIDIVKVPPAGWIEKHLPGGWGVVGDDVVAGLYTCAIVHAVVKAAPGWVGVYS